jgi:predicted ATPase
MEGKRTIEKIRLRNILSFGDKGEEIELQPLNVLIGQNASGKSNFIDIFKLLFALTEEKMLTNFTSKSGGTSEWLWKGKKVSKTAEVKVWLELTEYFIALVLDSQTLYIADEYIRVKRTKKNYKRAKFSFPILSTGKSPNLKSPNLLTLNDLSTSFFHFDLTKLNLEISIPEYSVYFGEPLRVFSEIATYTELQVSRKSEIRKPQLPDVPNNFLDEDASNLALVLNDLEHRGNTKDKIVSYLKKFNPRIKDYSIRILGGTVQLFVREEGLEKPISAMRLSDGTLRYLCLLAILCHPEPPPLICLEEPEVGLHPDILPTIAELLIDASSRTQLIVTTHSDILVSALSDVPEAVLVCEADEDGTHFKRLDKENLKEWLDEYELGELWLKGEIGGKRW